MNRLYLIIQLLLPLSWWSCGDGSPNASERPVDSQMVAEHVDPSTKFPQQVIEVDSLQRDPDFVTNARNRAEETLALARLGAEKASDTAVKAIAQRIANDQETLHQSWKGLSKSEGPGDSTVRYTDGSREELKKLTGKAFDRQWVEKMVTWNAADISRYAAESEAAKDKTVKRIAGEALPRLKAHQQQLESCRSKFP
ncbi:DUF4142 domain-containing protein [Paraflavitalea pollutisoli]|uniref:DUF4142 domain-containing protein n=1 Tax=Paraflavitalea pollutisoli TaxID=3034143 RepID=UPI0023EDFEB0|nr:DUF4142 domain-containing protein [Paraflavitalea sp. H1-2-19X]